MSTRIIFRAGRAALVAGVLLAAPTGVSVAVAQSVSPVEQDTAFRDRVALSTRFFGMPQRLRDSLSPPVWVDADTVVFWDELGENAGTWVRVDAASGRMNPLISPEDQRRQLGEWVGRPVETVPQTYFMASPDNSGIVFGYEDLVLRLGLDGRIVPASKVETAVYGGAIAAPGGRLSLGAEDGLVVSDHEGREVLRLPKEEGFEWSVPQRPWSPDGRIAAVWKIDQRSVHRIPIVDYANATETLSTTPYAKSGTPLAVSQLQLVDPQTGAVAIAPVSEEAGYDWFVGWRPDGRTALIMHLTRDGKRLTLSSVDRAGRRTLLLTEERPETNVGDLDFIVDDWETQVTLLPDGGFLWMSERDGWRHVYRYDAAGGLVGRITEGDFPVRRVDAVAASGEVVLSAAVDADDPYDVRPYRTTLSGGALTPLTATRGVHRLTPSPTARHVIDSWSSRDEPRTRDLVNIETTRAVRLTAADATAVREMGWSAPEAVRVLAADGETVLHGAIYRPRDFDPEKRYPVIAYIYGAPFANVLAGSFIDLEMLRANSLAQAGFIVAAFDVRGSSGRSKGFQDANYGRVGQTEIPDYVAGLRQVAATRPWMDLGRLGITGHSWGGYYVLRAMLSEPDLFLAGYAGAPGALDEGADVNEPSMGLPQDNPAGYAAGSNSALAANLRGHLRIMHGTSDSSAPLSSTMRMADALIGADRRFELLLMPGVTHNARGPRGQYYHEDIVRFFLRTLGDPQAGPAGQRP